MYRRRVVLLLAAALASPTGAQSPCVVQDQGDSHRLEIGVTAAGAFVRFAADTTPRTPSPPLPARVYAGKRIGAAAEARFSPLTPAAGLAIAYEVPSEGGGFPLTATHDAEALLAIVAEAKDHFLVVEGPDGLVQDYVAIHSFDREQARSLLACKAQHIR